MKVIHSEYTTRLIYYYRLASLFGKHFWIDARSNDYYLLSFMSSDWVHVLYNALANIAIFSYMWLYHSSSAPYSYPFPNERNQNLYKKYQEMADKEADVTCKFLCILFYRLLQSVWRKRY